MSDQDPPPRAARVAAKLRDLRAAALVYYESNPYVEDGYSRLLGGETCELDANDVSDLLEPLFEDRYRLAYDDEWRRVVIRTRLDDPDTADPVPRHELTAVVCWLLTELPDPPRGASPRLREAVATARELARLAMPRNPRRGQGPPRGARVRWVGDVVSNVLESLEDLPDFAGEVDWPDWRAMRKPKPAAAPKPDPAAIESAARAFVAALSPGRHPVPETWAAYVDATPPDARLGKHAFLALARDLLGEPRKIRGVRLWVVPEPAVLAEVTERVARLAWDDQRAYLVAYLTRRTARPEAERMAA